MIADDQLAQGERFDAVLRDLYDAVATLPEEHRLRLAAPLERLDASLKFQQHLLDERRKNEIRLSTMADGTPVLNWATDAEGKMEYINLAYRDFFGVTLEDVIAGGWQPLVHPDDLQAYLENYLVCLKDHTPFRAQARIRRADGEWRWVDSRGQPRFSDAGEFQGISGSSIDVTDRIQSQEAMEKVMTDLINERNRLLAVMEALPVGLAIYDTKGGVIQSNQYFEEVWGSPRPPADSVEDYDQYQAWWVESGERVQPEEWAAARAVQNGETVTGQYIRIRKFDGTYAFVLNSGAPVRDANGSITGATVAIMDITQRVQAEQALMESNRSLKESEDRFRVMLTSAPLLVYTCDLEQRYTSVFNPRPGHKVEDFIGKRDDELLPYEYVKDLLVAKQWALDNGKAGVREVSVFIDGEMTYHLLAMEPQRDTDGVLIGLVCSAIDITEQKRLMREQEQKMMQIEMQRRLMEYRDKERQELAREIHDGPIQTLSGTIFNLQYTRGMLQNPELHDEIDKIGENLRAAVSELREVVNELRPPTLIRFGLAKAINIYADDFRERHPELDLSLEVEEDDVVLPEEVAIALFRIYQEGLNNIFRHAHATRATACFKMVDQNAVLEIVDNGVGFSVEPDPASLTEKGHFGIAGMKERAEIAGGTFFTDSQPGQGTIIKVVIPIPLLESKPN